MNLTTAGKRTLSAVVVLLLIAALGTWIASRPDHEESGPPCRVRIGADSFSFDTEQAANAATIAGVGKKMGLANHAATIALATALQESELHNIDFGDRDSVGLFQQRPSQGWGTADQIMVPRYAASAFYSRLVKVSNWQNLSVTDAAQNVQRSAAPDAYANWEASARLMAQAFTGEVPAAFACKTDVKESKVVGSGLNAAINADLGAVRFDTPATPTRGWLVASWLIAHSVEYDVSSVTYAGQKWSATSGTWEKQHDSSNLVRFNV